MRRLRLATLALASGVLVTLSGCAAPSSTSCNSGMFSRLFGGNMFSRSPEYVSTPDCECHNSFMPSMTSMGTVQGPMVMPSAGMPSPSSIPITNAPSSPPPNIMRMPQNAVPTPYAPTFN